MLRNPEFDSKDVDPDLHKRMNRAVEDGRIKSFNMREDLADGDQDLNLSSWLGELEDVVRCFWQETRHPQSLTSVYTSLYFYIRVYISDNMIY